MNTNSPHFFDLVFVVLVYKNIEVLRDFFKSLRIPFTYKVIVVNSFFDEESQDECERVALDNNADFVAIPNKGYSYGNNVGCLYAIEHYNYRFLLVSNSDVIINDFDYLDYITEKKAVYAPETKMLSGHRQNPNIPYKSRLFLYFLTQAYKYESDIILRIAHIVNRFYREVYLLYSRIVKNKCIKIFAPHGSFIIFTYLASKELMPIFNDKMFLYNEELFLAFHCKQKDIPVYYVPKLKITHLEGASSNASINSWSNHKQSFNVLQTWIKDSNL